MMEDSYPLSPMQQGMLFHAIRDPHSGVDIEQMLCTLREAVDPAAIRRAWQRVVDRHAVLRTSFRWEGLEAPIQEVHGEVCLSLEEQDWRDLPPDGQERRRAAYLERDRQRGFDMTRAPLMRLALFRLGDARYQLVWTFHHALMDGRSFPIVLKELFAFYDGCCSGTDLELAPPPSYRRYIEWLQQQEFAHAESFWRPRLAGFTAPTPLISPAPHRESETEEPRHRQQTRRLSAAVATSLRELVEQHQVTLNTCVQGAWGVLLSRYSGEEDVLFGATRACRRSSVEGAEAMVGLLINTLPVRARVAPGLPVRAYLQRLRTEQLQVRDYEHTPLSMVQSWSDVSPGTPLFESLLVFENYHLSSRMQAEGSEWQQREFQLLEQTNYPLTLAAYADQELTLRLDYDPSRFDEATIDRMLGHLAQLLEGMGADPKQRLCELTLLSPAERRQLLAQPHAASMGTEKQPCLHQLFERQVERTPDAVAVLCDCEALTYAQLNARANQVAHCLQAWGVGPEVRVGICVERSLEMIVGILAILKAGGAYVPLDLAYPSERLELILTDARVPVLLTQEALLEKVPKYGACVVCLDSERERFRAASEENPAGGAAGDHAAYVIYTSGSTGRPKGVLVTHGNVARLFAATDAWFHFDRHDVWSLFHSFAFDFSVWEIWGALLYGGRLVVVPYEVSRSPEAFLELLRRERVTVLNQTPSAFRQLMQAEAAAESGTALSLRWVIFGGEALELPSLQPWFDRHGDQRPRLVNMYGITETTVHVTYRPLAATDAGPAAGSVIGVAIPDLQLYLLDARGEPVPVGVAGEMYVGGAGVARGYLNRPELTAERFVPDPFSGLPGARLYRSGDLARYRPDGELEYLGRADQQVKIRGFRIELGEIASALVQHPRVRDCVVLAREDAPGEKRLVGYLVPEGARAPGRSELRQFLQERLPEYMVPAAFVTLEALPLNNNGKVDRRALPPPDQGRPELERAYVAPRSQTETRLVEVWEKVLGVQPIGIRDNFFDLGGHSLLAVRLIGQLEKTLGRDLPLRALFHAPTIEQLASLLERSAPAERLTSLVPIQPHGTRAPFFCISNLGGGIDYYRDLARHLGPDQPLYSLHPLHSPSLGRRADGKFSAATRIRDTAAHYLSEIRMVQPLGPYHLGGHCLGGTVAFELAQQLHAQGERVALLALFEPSPIHFVSSQEEIRAKSSYHLRQLLRLGLRGKLAQMRKLGASLKERATQWPYKLWPQLGELLPRPLRNTWRAQLEVERDIQGGRQYAVQVYSGDAILFLSSARPDDPHRPGFEAWAQYVRGSLQVHEVPGDHGTMMTEPNLTFTAEILRTCLDRAQREQDRVGVG